MSHAKSNITHEVKNMLCNLYQKKKKENHSIIIKELDKSRAILIMEKHHNGRMVFEKLNH